jgi:hypothetical protein
MLGMKRASKDTAAVSEEAPRRGAATVTEALRSTRPLASEDSTLLFRRLKQPPSDVRNAAAGNSRLDAMRALMLEASPQAHAQGHAAQPDSAGAARPKTTSSATRGSRVGLVGRISPVELMMTSPVKSTRQQQQQQQGAIQPSSAAAKGAANSALWGSSAIASPYAAFTKRRESLSSARETSNATAAAAAATAMKTAAAAAEADENDATQAAAASASTVRASRSSSGAGSASISGHRHSSSSSKREHALPKLLQYDPLAHDRGGVDSTVAIGNSGGAVQDAVVLAALGIVYSVCSIKGHRPYMEDEYRVIANLTASTDAVDGSCQNDFAATATISNNNTIAGTSGTTASAITRFFGVFDGHGKYLT